MPLLLGLVVGAHAQAPVHLPSWNDVAVKSRVVALVSPVGEFCGRHFVLAGWTAA